MYGIGLAVEKQVALPKVKSVADAKMRTGATSVAGEIDAYLPTILAAAGLGLWRFHPVPGHFTLDATARSEEHTSELQSLMRISYAVFCLKKKKLTHHTHVPH